MRWVANHRAANPEKKSALIRLPYGPSLTPFILQCEFPRHAFWGCEWMTAFGAGGAVARAGGGWTKRWEPKTTGVYVAFAPNFGKKEALFRWQPIVNPKGSRSQEYDRTPVDQP
jgi:hypothetical protein